MASKLKKVAEYKAREGAPINNAQALLVGQEVETMQAEGVDVTPAKLLDRACSPKHPLHALFDWDDKSAAEAWRLHWARTLISSVVTIDIKSKSPAKAFYSITVSKDDGSVGREYHPRRTIMASDVARGQVSAQLYQQISALVKNARQLGLGEEDGAWSRIISAVESSKPVAVLVDVTETAQTA